MSVLVLYYKVAPEKISSMQVSELIHLWAEELPANKQQQISKLRQQNDQILSLAGLQLLKLGIFELSDRQFTLKQLKFPKQKKPYISGELEGKFDFNISHSRDIVCCVISDSLQVGIDIELHRQVTKATLEKFLAENTKNLESPKEETLAEFFKIWTKNEAIIKAANYGSIFNMKDLDLKENGGEYQNNFWHTYPINISTDKSHSNDTDKEYTCHIACSESIADNEITIQHIFTL